MVFTVVVGFLGLTAGSIFMIAYSIKKDKKPKKEKNVKKDSKKTYI